ncbi:MAG: regulatory protein GemA [Candidatus Fimivivens sp.]
MAKISTTQIKDIYTLGSALGIKGQQGRDDELHALVSALTQKDGISELTSTEAVTVITELKRRMTPGGGQQLRKRPKKQKQQKQHEAAPGGITEGQQRKVWAMMYQLEKASPPSNATLGDRLCGIIKRQFGMDTTLKSPLAWLTYAQGAQLIEILKGYVASAQQKRLRGEA